MGHRQLGGGGGGVASHRPGRHAAQRACSSRAPARPPSPWAMRSLCSAPPTRVPRPCPPRVLLLQLYDTPNPFDWMDMISLQGKTNFFGGSLSGWGWGVHRAPSTHMKGCPAALAALATNGCVGAPLGGARSDSFGRGGRRSPHAARCGRAAPPKVGVTWPLTCCSHTAPLKCRPTLSPPPPTTHLPGSERRVGEYQRAGVMQSVVSLAGGRKYEHVFTLDEDF